MKCVILCDGRPPEPEQIRQQVEKSDLFIAADGGAITARRLNLSPNYIVGDMDSYEINGEEAAEVIRDPDQETNDLEKALALAHKSGADDVAVFGATGWRLDHTLKNLSVMRQFNSQFRSLIFMDRFSKIFLLPPRFSATLPTGTPISLFPLSGRVEGITTKGLLYPLNDEFLENGVRDGTSNETSNKKVEIIHKKGDLLIFINHGLLHD
ncbi:MAG: thiamine diphosphokinase [Balneolaceae bacterium]|nr:thiamine diphosphokinase [Balneolaceae bacterium]MCH8548088.1 thiamine diphosphokinase [Balneolaceae bacterium]